MFPVDPGADATIGGMAATRASGTTAVRYGTMRENVLGLTVVLADGRVIHTGGRARKSSSGYDLTRLFVGSEGTLGVITEVTLRLFGRPEAVAAAVCPFRSMEGATRHGDHDDSARHPGGAHRDHRRAAARRSSIATRRRTIRLRRRCSSSSTASARRPWTSRRVPCRRSPPRTARWISSGRRRPRSARRCGRRVTTCSTRRSRRGRAPSRGRRTSACRSRACRSASSRRRTICGGPNIVAPLVGHAGDGNFHLIFMVDTGDAAEMESVKAANARLVERALRLGGTCTGEHGVGFGKLKYLAEEHGESLDTMRAIKRALDPHNMMNPGKLIPECRQTRSTKGTKARRGSFVLRVFVPSC